MQADKLISMANQIAGFFRSYPAEQAVAGVNHHLHAFWTPKMVETLQDHMAHETGGIDPLVLQAMQRNPTTDSPVERALAPGQAAGPMASDAG